MRLSFHGNVLDEVHGYLSYILERYDTLPKRVLFIKGSFSDYAQYSDLADADMWTHITPHLNLHTAVDYAPLPTWYFTPHAKDLPILQARIETLASISAEACGDCPASMNVPKHIFMMNEFIASRRAIRAWPRAVYAHLLEQGLMQTKPLDHANARRHGSLYSRFWLSFYMESGGFQALFGGDNATPESFCQTLRDNVSCERVLQSFTSVPYRVPVVSE